MTRDELRRRVAKTEAIMSAIETGLNRGDQHYKMTYDRAVAVKVELEKVFQLRFKPARKGGE